MVVTAKVSCYCPPMPVTRVGRKLRRTAEEPMVVTVTFEDGRTLSIAPVTIPPTDVVQRIQPLKISGGRMPVATVAACVGSGGDASARIVIKLPPEPVVLDFAKGVTVALAIDAPTTLTLADGRVFVGSIRYPDCKTSGIFGDLVAEAVTARGTLELLAAPQRRKNKLSR